MLSWKTRQISYSSFINSRVIIDCCLRYRKQNFAVTKDIMNIIKYTEYRIEDHWRWWRLLMDGWDICVYATASLVYFNYHRALQAGLISIYPWQRAVHDGSMNASIAAKCGRVLATIYGRRYAFTMIFYEAAVTMHEVWPARRTHEGIDLLRCNATT